MNKGVLEKTKKMVSDGVKPKTIYNTSNNSTGGVYFSTSQSNELRDSKQVYRQSQQLKAENKCGNENYYKKDELMLQLNCNERRRVLYGLYHAYVIAIIYLLPTMFN